MWLGLAVFIAWYVGFGIVGLVARDDLVPDVPDRVADCSGASHLTPSRRRRHHRHGHRHHHGHYRTPVCASEFVEVYPNIFENQQIPKMSILIRWYIQIPI